MMEQRNTSAKYTQCQSVISCYAVAQAGVDIDTFYKELETAL